MRRDFQKLRRRRLRAARLFAAGIPQAEIARELEVSRQSVSVWHEAWRKGGVEAVRGPGRAGRKPRLTARQIQAIDRALREGPVAHGFSTSLWTLPRVAAVIERVTGVRYHPGHVWRVLRETLGWSLQRPTRRARERNDRRIRRWVREVWPSIKKKPADFGPGSSFSTKRASRNPPPSDAPGPLGARRPS